jgi:hypothetical protein
MEARRILAVRIAHAHLDRQRELFDVGDERVPPGSLLGFGQRRQQLAGKNREPRDCSQQFHPRKCCALTTAKSGRNSRRRRN